jgi:hypothetical protein
MSSHLYSEQVLRESTPHHDVASSKVTKIIVTLTGADVGEMVERIQRARFAESSQNIAEIVQQVHLVGRQVFEES